MSPWWEKRQAEGNSAVAVQLEVLKGVKALEEAPDNISEALTSQQAEKAGATTTLKNDIKDHNKTYKKKLDEKIKAASKKESHEVTHQAAMQP
jgi:poly-D-alanine transfer protein DltD